MLAGLWDALRLFPLILALITHLGVFIGRLDTKYVVPVERDFAFLMLNTFLFVEYYESRVLKLVQRISHREVLLRHNPPPRWTAHGASGLILLCKIGVPLIFHEGTPLLFTQVYYRRNNLLYQGFSGLREVFCNEWLGWLEIKGEKK